MNFDFAKKAPRRMYALKCIVQWIVEYQNSPTAKQLGEKMNIHHRTAARHMECLCKDGTLTRNIKTGRISIPGARYVLPDVYSILIEAQP